MLEANEYVEQEAKCSSASRITSSVTSAHPISAPLLLGQAQLLQEGASASSMDSVRVLADLRGVWSSIREQSVALARAEAQAKPGEEAQREERADKIASRMPVLRSDAADALPALDAYHEAVRKLATIGGERHVLALLRQRCQWRRWAQLRMERIQALTVLKGTRTAAKRHSEITKDLAMSRGKEEVLVSLAPHTRPPPCTVTLRPAGLGALPGATTVASFNEAVRRYFLLDIAECLTVSDSRFEIAAQGMDAALQNGEEATQPLDATLSLELMAAAGACDLKITVSRSRAGSYCHWRFPCASAAASAAASACASLFGPSSHPCGIA